MPWIAAILVVVGLTSMTVSVVGILRLSDPYLQAHAAGNSVLFGVVPVLVASIGTGDGAIVLRAALVALFLLLTAPISAHVVARAVHRRNRERGTAAAPDS